MKIMHAVVVGKWDKYRLYTRMC